MASITSFETVREN